MFQHRCPSTLVYHLIWLRSHWEGELCRMTKCTILVQRTDPCRIYVLIFLHDGTSMSMGQNLLTVIKNVQDSLLLPPNPAHIQVLVLVPRLIPFTHICIISDYDSLEAQFPNDDSSVPPLDQSHGMPPMNGFIGGFSAYRPDRPERFSRKVFVGGLPPDIDEGMF